MSRLIFEGNTRERFGDLFPRPIIEEIKVFDNNIEVDVALYFEKKACNLSMFHKVLAFVCQDSKLPR